MEELQDEEVLNLKIVIPVGDLVTGGGTRALAVLANALVRAGHEVDIVIPESAGIDYSLSCNVVRVPALAPAFIPYGDVVLINYYSTFGPAYQAWPRQCVRLCQGYEPLWVPDKDYALATYATEVPIITISHWLDEQIYRSLHKRTRVENLGVNRRSFHPKGHKKPHHRKVIMYIARDPSLGYRMKGFHDFVRAMRRFHHSYDGRYVVYLVCPERRLSLGHIPHKVFQPRTDKELAHLYRRADVFVSTSHYEGFGLPPLEAMACGTPVVTTDSGGIRDFSVHKQTVYMTKPRDYRRIAHGMKRVLEDAGLRAKLIANGLYMARGFDERTQYRRLVRAIEEIHQERQL